MATDMQKDGAEPENRSPSSRREQIAEVSVFLFLIVPSLIFSFFIVQQGGTSFVLLALSTIFRDLGLVGLILFFAWRNGERLDLIGWSFKNVRKDALLGLWLFIPFFFGAGLLENALRMIGFSAPGALSSLSAEKTAPGFLLAAVLVVVVALAEETIFRGYLILRFRNVTANTAAAALLSSVIFSLGHGYEGSAGAVTVGVMGLVFALIYLWRRSLVAPMVMHFLQDFIGIVLLPLLGMRQ